MVVRIKPTETWKHPSWSFRWNSMKVNAWLPSTGFSSHSADTSPKLTVIRPMRALYNVTIHPERPLPLQDRWENQVGPQRLGKVGYPSARAGLKQKRHSPIRKGTKREHFSLRRYNPRGTVLRRWRLDDNIGVAGITSHHDREEFFQRNEAAPSLQPSHHVGIIETIKLFKPADLVLVIPQYMPTCFWSHREPVSRLYLPFLFFCFLLYSFGVHFTNKMGILQSKETNDTPASEVYRTCASHTVHA
jgi:hypothetical protein